MMNREMSMPRRMHLPGAIAALIALLGVLMMFLAVATNARAGELLESVSATTSDARAGSHGDFTVDLRLGKTDGSASGGIPEARAQLRSVVTQLPAGLVGDPQLPTCSPSEFRRTQGYCPEGTQVGVAEITSPSSSGATQALAPIFNLERRDDQLARFGFMPFGLAAFIFEAKLREDGNYNVMVDVPNVPTAVPSTGVKLTLWGVPADDSHNTLRVSDADAANPSRAPCFRVTQGRHTGANCDSAQPRKPLLTSPTRCDVAEQVTADATFWPWPGPSDSAVSSPLAYTDCDSIAFDPTIALSPTINEAGKPTGVSTEVRVPRERDADPDGRATGTIKDVTVSLPEGMAISPAAASGLMACTDTQAAIGVQVKPYCPDSAKVGTVEVASPVLDRPMTGAVYIGEQRSNDPTSGDMYRMIVIAQGSGATVKLPGSIKADPRTGQLTVSFRSAPQLPFDQLKMDLSGGDSAALTTPMKCGEYSSRYEITSWSGQTVDGQSNFTIDGNCGNGSTFAPIFSAGMVNPAAGAFSPFTMKIERGESDEELSGISVQLPQGLLAALGSVPLCGEAQAAAGTCDAASRVGTSVVSAGQGGRPYALDGPVYLAGPYKGAPFSLSIAVDAKAGPFDLGKVVVRSPLQVDASKAQASAPADPLPTIVGGVPLRVRSVSITLDRPGFTFNATDCTRREVAATLTSVSGRQIAAATPYQADGCANLPLDPKLSVQFTGGRKEMSKFKHPGVIADLAQTPGQSGLKQVEVTLPQAVALDPEAANVPGRLCMPEQVAARACPESSRVGTAEARTVALHEPLKGPVYFIKGTRVENGKTISTLPKLYLKLDGEGVPLDLIGDSRTEGGKRLVATFASVPDAPITSMRLVIDPGSRSVLVANTNVCNAKKVLSARFDGQNGKRVTTNARISAPDCKGARIASAKVGRDYLSVQVVGIDPGRVTMRSNGSATRKQTVRLDDTATLRAKLTRKARRSIARGSRTKIAVRVVFQPSAKGAKSKTIRKTITVRRKAKTR